MASIPKNSRRVAIVGAGPGGLVAARYLLAHGFEPVLFEQSSQLGGQWNQGAAHSGVWPGMFTNTSRVMTRFSDLEWSRATKMFPRNDEVLAYLASYAQKFGISEHIRLEHAVSRIESAVRGWAVSFNTPDGGAETEIFSYVIVASGRYTSPRMPDLRGLESFCGAGGIEHTFHFRDARRYNGQRVLVAGCAISAVEIAPELVFAGAARVVSCMRRQRYVLQRVIAGVPLDFLFFTRYSAIAKERLPLGLVRHRLKEFILRTSGTPQQWGALKAEDDPYIAGITQTQFYLPLVADGRIVVKPWIRSTEGRRVTFEDASAEEFDAILFATGFQLDLPFVSEAIRQKIGADGPALRLYRHTFHPQLPGLAFIGQFHQAGPYFPPLELQARWVTYVWSGACPAPDPIAMAQEIASQQPSEAPLRMDDCCIGFARDAGVEPDPERWPELKRALLFGPLAPISFRLSGSDALPDAAGRFAAEAAQFGALPSRELTPEQQLELETLEEANPAAVVG